MVFHVADSKGKALHELRAELGGSE
jgi:hypothetical protein